MSFTRTKRIAATTTAATLAAGGVLLAFAPAASAAPTRAELGAPVVQVPLNHALTVAARDSGIPAALANLDITIPVQGWERVIDSSANVLAIGTARAAQYPNGCASYEFYLPPSGGWAAAAASYINCPW
ncbi:MULTISPECIES: hypothetical protein [unclassified Rhodococcus (in: high G+C Gram-positive bacteria)]|uniref:hypothetical protein n=1 Tax=unclassified Rhodococcus (in: high G+C Gram-positive bacteria) TaxID=192944 RepID=UPI00117BCBBA|nr:MULTISPECIES: hypothetical protein [unclassified Rhodococcus (in: high G+C Gram-positive bacteria)]